MHNIANIFNGEKVAQNNAKLQRHELPPSIINSFKFYYTCQCLRKTSLFTEEEVGGDLCGNFERNYWVFSRALKVETTSSL